jgi:hypothetical protein
MPGTGRRPRSPGNTPENRRSQHQLTVEATARPESPDSLNKLSEFRDHGLGRGAAGTNRVKRACGARAKPGSAFVSGIARWAALCSCRRPQHDDNLPVRTQQKRRL